MKTILVHPRDKRAYNYGDAGKLSNREERERAFDHESQHRPIYPPIRVKEFKDEDYYYWGLRGWGL